MDARPVSELFSRLTEHMAASDIKSADLLSKIASEIVLKRLELGMSQKDFAKYLGVSQGMVSRWENGDYNFTIKTICRVFEKLNLDFEFRVQKDPAYSYRRAANNILSYSANPWKLTKVSVDENKLLSAG